MSKTTKVVIADIQVTYRKEEIPLTCPTCKLDLTVGKVTAWEYQDQRRVGPLRVVLGDDPDDDPVLWDSDKTPEGGEEFISYVNVQCANCGHVLAEGGMEISGPEGSDLEHSEVAQAENG